MKRNILTLGLIGLASVFALNAGVVNAEETSSEVEFTSGDLTISPDASIIFDSNQLTGQHETIVTNASNDFNLTVTDATGSRNGWKVQASHNDFTHTNREDTLDGAKINLLSGNLSNSLPIDGVEIEPIISIGTEDTSISSAAVGSGMGIFGHNWAKEDINLTIPEDTAQKMLAGQYSTTINWTLTASPEDDATPGA